MSSHKRRRSRPVLIDWFTVAAQALNFIILVWLMKRVLYKPIMAAIDARETLVAAELAEAAGKMNSANKAAEEFEHKNENFERDRAALMIRAGEEAKAQGNSLLEAARVAAEALQSKRRDAWQQEETDLSESFKRRAQQAFFELSRRAFKDLADSTLEAQVASVFCDRLRAMKQEDKSKLGTAIQASTQPVLVRSAFPLTLDLQNTLQAVIDTVFERPVALRFEVASPLVVGIELTAHGQRVGWSIGEYLTAFEGDVTDALPRATPPANLNPTINLNPPASEAAGSPPAKLLAFT
jgi:F-type H+-transporting ATPase subunit b